MNETFIWQRTPESVEITPDNLLLLKTATTDQQQRLVAQIHQVGAENCVAGVRNQVISLVFTDKPLWLALPPDVEHITVSVHPLCEIMAFLDESQQTLRDNSDKEFFLNADITSYDELIYWFICCYLMGNSQDDYAQLLECIRKQESYFLTGYLIKNRCSSEKINTLCQTYGLSYSYFRKISKRYLGTSAKTKMSEWRLAQTILDILEGESSITDIALKNGYSSSAHVCSTFKSALGISPYAIRKINDKGS